MDKLLLFTSKYLIGNSESLNHFKCFIKHNSLSLPIIPISETEPISQDDLTTKLNQLVNLIFNFNKGEILYYVVSLIRKACELENIDMTALLETLPIKAFEVPNLIVKKKTNNKKKFKVIKATDSEPGNSRTRNSNFKEKSRSSKYRGVSKTGNRWQVLLMHEKRYYYGSYNDEITAAKVYDKYAIRHFGKNAKTNFEYSNSELETMLSNAK